MSELSAEEQAWEDRGRVLADNPIVNAVVDHALNVLAGNSPEEDALHTTADVIERWVWYLAEGEQEVSWHPPILAQANAWLEQAAVSHGVSYRPGMTEPAA